MLCWLISCIRALFNMLPGLWLPNVCLARKDSHSCWVWQNQCFFIRSHCLLCTEGQLAGFYILMPGLPREHTHLQGVCWRILPSSSLHPNPISSPCNRASVNTQNEYVDNKTYNCTEMHRSLSCRDSRADSWVTRHISHRSSSSPVWRETTTGSKAALSNTVARSHRWQFKFK